MVHPLQRREHARPAGHAPQVLLESLETRRLLSGLTDAAFNLLPAASAEQTPALAAPTFPAFEAPTSVPAGLSTPVVSITASPSGVALVGTPINFTIRVASPYGGGATGQVQVDVSGADTSTSTWTLYNGSIGLVANAFSAGPHQITVTYLGDANYAAGEIASTSVNMLTDVPTTLTLSAPDTASLYVPVTVAASITDSYGFPPTGSITFTPGGSGKPVTVSVNGTSAWFTYTPMSPQDLTGTATFTCSSGNFQLSSAQIIPMTLVKLPISTTVNTGLTGAMPAGSRIPITAQVNAPSGAVLAPGDVVTFYDGDTVLGTATLSSYISATFTFLTAGVHSLTARLTGDPYIQDQPTAFTQTITPATIINLLVVYASDVSFSDSDPVSALQGAVDDTNNVFYNSQIPVTIVLVHIQEESYISSGNYYTDLSRLQTSGDGYMDDVPALRRQYGADLVSLFVASTGAPSPTDPTGSQLDGLGSELLYTGGDVNAAFSVIHAADAGYPYYTLAHELGHNLGASHDAAHNTNKNPAFPSGQGYRFTGGDGVVYRDVMSYEPGVEIPYFSNPAVSYMGVAEGKPGSADVAHVIMKTAPIVARYHDLLGAAANQLPTGAIETSSLTTITGWAWDPDSGTAPIQVRMDIDGQVGPVIDADVAHALLAGKPGSQDHGFVFNLPTLSVGQHTIAIYAVNAPYDAAPRNAVLLGKLTLTNHAPTLTIEVANSAVISGWVQDKDSPAIPVAMQIIINGTTYGPFDADVDRPDLQVKLGSANHGFSFDVASNLSYGAHKVEIDVYDTPNGEMVVARKFTLKVSNVAPIGKVTTATATTMSGWVYDQNMRNGQIAVQVFIDGVGGTTINATDGGPDLTLSQGGPAMAFTYAVPQNLPVGKHTIAIYGLNTPSVSGSAEYVLLGKMTVTNRAPVLTLDVANGGTIAGWAYDPDAPTTSLQARIDIDSNQGDTLAADLPRPDLASRLGSNHGFSYDIPTDWSAGKHVVTVNIEDVQSGAMVLCRTFTISKVDVLPTAKLETATASLLSGWAFDQNAASAAIQVRVDIDGTPGTPFLANSVRQDLLKTLGSTNHGWSFTLPSGLAKGRHTIRINLLDEPTETWRLWKTLTLTV